MKYATYTRDEADRVARVPLKLRFPDRYEDGRGLPPGRQHGEGPRNPSGTAYTTHADTVWEGRLSGEYHVAVTDDDLPSSVIRHDPDDGAEMAPEDPTIDGILTRPARVGVVMVRGDFKADPVDEPAVRTR